MPSGPGEGWSTALLFDHPGGEARSTAGPQAVFVGRALRPIVSSERPGGHRVFRPGHLISSPRRGAVLPVRL